MKRLKTKWRRNVSAKRHALRSLEHRTANAESILWKYLSDARLEGFNFERRVGIEDRAFPFFCRAAKLAIEIDRDTRDGSSNRDYKSDAYLLAQGILVGHFEAKRIRSAPEQVVEQILFLCRRRTEVHPTVVSSPPTQTVSPSMHELTASRSLGCMVWVAPMVGIIILVVLMFFQIYDVSGFVQGIQFAQKPLATLTLVPTPSSQRPSPTVTEITSPAPSDAGNPSLASSPIFAQAEKNLSSQPQSVIDLLLPRLSQFTAKSDLEDAYSYLGRAELALKHYHAAADYFKRLYALEPSIEYLYPLAVAYDLDGDFQNALTSYRALAVWNGDNSAIYRALAQQRVKELESKLGTPMP